MALGNSYRDQGQFGLAEAQFRAAIAIDATRSNYHSALAAVLASEQKPADAETEFRTAIGLDPKNAQAHFELAGLLSTEPNRQAEAAAEYEQARALDPKLVPPATATPAQTGCCRRHSGACVRNQAAQQALPPDPRFSGLPES